MKNRKSILTILAAGGLLLSSSLAFAGGACCSGMTAYKAMKSKTKDIVATAQGTGSFNTLIAAVNAAGLTDTLMGEGPFTVFAPTDEAFAKIPAETLQNLLKPENRATLADILTYHVVPGKVLAADVRNGAVSTANGAKVNLNVSAAGAFINGARIIDTDIMAGNGVIHVIDSVIMPPKGLTMTR